MRKSWLREQQTLRSVTTSTALFSKRPTHLLGRNTEVLKSSAKDEQFLRVSTAALPDLSLGYPRMKVYVGKNTLFT